LGNQLFQLAAALKISKDVDIRLLSRSLTMYERPFEPDVARLLDLKQIGVEVRKGRSLQDNLVTFGRIGLLVPLLGVNDRNFHQIAPGSRTTAAMEGYFQDFWVAEELVEIAAKLSAILDSSLSFTPPKPKATVLHLRGLDFQNDSNLSILGLPWFRQAFETCYDEEEVDHLLVVTDDVQLAEEWTPQIVGKRNLNSISFQSSQDPLADFLTLRSACRRIVGNSTFGQWATLLDDKQGRTFSSKWLAKGRSKNWHLSHEQLI
jgi:hypothetical protein